MKRRALFLGISKSFKSIRSGLDKCYVDHQHGPDWPEPRRKAYRASQEYKKWFLEFRNSLNNICQVTGLRYGERLDILKEYGLPYEEAKYYAYLAPHHKMGVQYDSKDYDDYILAWNPMHVGIFHRPAFMKKLGIELINGKLDVEQASIAVVVGVICLH